MTRKKYSKEIKAKIAIEAIKGEKTIQELSQIHKIHPNRITSWKKKLLTEASGIFERNQQSTDENKSEKKMTELYSQIGMLQVEKEFLKKKYKQIYGTEPIL